MTKAETAKRKLAALDCQGEELTIRMVMDTPHGRRWLWRLLEECAIFQENDNYEPYQMAASKGKRKLGVLILQRILAYTPTQYATMTRESTEVDLQITDAAAQDLDDAVNGEPQ